MQNIVVDFLPKNQIVSSVLHLEVFFERLLQYDGRGQSHHRQKSVNDMYTIGEERKRVFSFFR